MSDGVMTTHAAYLFRNPFSSWKTDFRVRVRTEGPPVVAAPLSNPALKKRPGFGKVADTTGGRR